MPDQSVQTNLDTPLLENAKKIVSNYEKIEKEWQRREKCMYYINTSVFVLLSSYLVWKIIVKNGANL